MTGQYASFGAQMKAGAEKAVADINAAGGVLGQQLVLEVGDDACDPKQAVAVANQFVGQGVQLRRRAFLLGLVDPGVRRSTPRRTSSRSRRPRPTRTSPTSVRARASSASAAVTTSRAWSPAHSSPRTSPTRTSPSSTTRPPTAKASPTRPSKSMNAARQGRGPLRGLHRRREGLHRPRLQAEGGEHRRPLCRRLPHRGRPDHAPDARPGHGHRAGLRRRARHRRVLADHRRRRRRHADDLLARSAQEPGAKPIWSRSSAPSGIEPEGYVALHLRRDPGLGRRPPTTAGSTDFDAGRRGARTPAPSRPCSAT